tara:strand:- start:367 stop:1593 length:1227 start_codon:yes stop_codon:yes gene_type:complete
MANLVNQHNFIWYGICETDDTSPKDGVGTSENGKCLPFPLADSGIHSAWYVDESGEKKSWSSVSSSNDFTELVCGNSYYVKLNKTDNTIDSVDIPHAVLSEQHYSAETCTSEQDPPVEPEPHSIKNLWIGFSTNDFSDSRHSSFYEVQGVEAETVLIELDNLSAYNGAAGSLGKQKIGKGAGETMIVTQDIVDGVEVDMFGTKVTLFPWTSAPSVDPLSNLIGSVITEDGGTFTINYTAEFDYTKFKIIEDGFATAIDAEIDASELGDTSHIMLVKSDTKPVYGQDGYTEALATAYNFPSEMVLKCNDTENYDLDAGQQTLLVLNVGGTLSAYVPKDSTDISLTDVKIENKDDKEWNGAERVFYWSVNRISTTNTNKPSLISEFYFQKANDGPKIKFGEGNPKGSHCE